MDESTFTKLAFEYKAIPLLMKKEGDGILRQALVQKLESIKTQGIGKAMLGCVHSMHRREQADNNIFFSEMVAICYAWEKQLQLDWPVLQPGNSKRLRPKSYLCHHLFMSPDIKYVAFAEIAKTLDRELNLLEYKEFKITICLPTDIGEIHRMAKWAYSKLGFLLDRSHHA